MTVTETYTDKTANINCSGVPVSGVTYSHSMGSIIFSADPPDWFPAQPWLHIDVEGDGGMIWHATMKIELDTSWPKANKVYTFKKVY